MAAATGVVTSGIGAMAGVRTMGRRMVMAVRDTDMVAAVIAATMAIAAEIADITTTANKRPGIKKRPSRASGTAFLTPSTAEGPSLFEYYSAAA